MGIRRSQVNTMFGMTGLAHRIVGIALTVCANFPAASRTFTLRKSSSGLDEFDSVVSLKRWNGHETMTNNGRTKAHNGSSDPFFLYLIVGNKRLSNQPSALQHA